MLIPAANTYNVSTLREAQNVASSGRNAANTLSSQGAVAGVAGGSVVPASADSDISLQAFPPVLAADQVSLSPFSLSRPQTPASTDQASLGNGVVSDDVVGNDLVGNDVVNNTNVGNEAVNAGAVGDVETGQTSSSADQNIGAQVPGVRGGSNEGANGDSNDDSDRGSESDQKTNPYQLTPEQQAQVDKLALRDAEVRAHEQAHKAVGGQYAGSISYEYQAGPDGKRYAVGGEVPIDVSPVQGDPQATIDKMTIVKAAALAPAEPSAQDQRVAALASQTISSARVELATENRERLSEGSDASSDSAKSTENESSAQTVESYSAAQGLNTYQSVSNNNEPGSSTRSALINKQA